MNKLNEFVAYYGHDCFTLSPWSDHRECWREAYRRARIARREEQKVCSPYDLKEVFADSHLLPYLTAALFVTKPDPATWAWVAP